MMDEEIFALSFDKPAESLWKAVKEVLSTGVGATLKQVDEEERRAIFTTDVSWTSWGENMIATVRPNQPTGSLLKVTGHPHTSLLTTKIGEDIHQHHFRKTFIQAVNEALGEKQ